MDRKRIRVFVRLALLLAVEVVLSRFLSVSTPYVKIGFAFVPLALAGMLYGPGAGLLVGAGADILGAVLFPIGPYFPGFTLTNALRGAVYGGLLRHGGGGSPWKVALAVGINGLVLSLGLNTLWIHLLYGSPILPLLATRAMQELLLMPLQMGLLLLVGAPKVQRVLTAR